MSTLTITNFKTLDEHIQSLPQELQDWIKELLIAPGLPAGRLMLDRAYKPPLGLQIDHKTRERFAKDLYGSGVAAGVTTALCRRGPWMFMGVLTGPVYDLMRRWLSALSKSHRELVETFLFDLTGLPRDSAMGHGLARRECYYARLDIQVQHGLVAIRFEEMQADGTYETKTVWEEPEPEGTDW